MTTPLEAARGDVLKAREALMRGDRRLARQLAERASRLAPQLEDPWLVLAAVAGPQLGIEFIQRALQINPNSPRARRGMEWVMQRLQQPDLEVGPPQPSSATQRQVARSAKPVTTRAKRSPSSRRRLFLPIILLLVGLGILSLAGWTAVTSPVVASMLAQSGLTPVPTQMAQWAEASIPKPTYTAPAPVVEVLPTPTAEPAATEAPTEAPADLSTDLSTGLSTEPSTPEPTAAALEPEVIEPEPTWSGTLSMDYVEDTPTPEAPPYVPPTAVQPGSSETANGVHWIDVDLSQQMVYAYAGDTIVNSFLVSTGTWMTPTVTGKYKIWIKLRYSDMSGPDYYLPNVPYVMYFYKGYGLHGTYWHNNFGTPMSHGCVNLSIPDAEWLYNFAYEGTVVNVHY